MEREDWLERVKTTVFNKEEIIPPKTMSGSTEKCSLLKISRFITVICPLYQILVNHLLSSFSCIGHKKRKESRECCR